jgi:hypothetical protein
VIVTLLPQSTLRYLWHKSAVGATNVPSTNGADYYAKLFAFELMAFAMYALVSQSCVILLRLPFSVNGTFRLLLAVLLTFLNESGSIQIVDKNQTAKWIGYSFLQFFFMYVSKQFSCLCRVVCCDPSLNQGLLAEPSTSSDRHLCTSYRIFYKSWPGFQYPSCVSATTAPMSMPSVASASSGTWFSC